MFTADYETIGDLSYGITKHLVYGTRDTIDLVTSADTQLHDVLVRARSCTYDDFDLKRVWLTPVRWGALVRQYIDPTALASWLDLVESKLQGRKRGISFMRTEVVNMSKNHTTGRERRRYGSCLLGFGYRALPHPQITMHSRTTYLGYIGQLDLALACVIAREVGQRVGLDPAEIRFTWHLEVAQFHGFKSLAWFFQQPDDRRKLEAFLDKPSNWYQRYPTMRLAANQLKAILAHDERGTLYGDMSFAQQTRVRRRYHTEVMGPEYGEQFAGGTLRPGSMRYAARVLPSRPISSLDLSPLEPGYSDPDTEKAGLLVEED